jgi:hypothetical protein
LATSLSVIEICRGSPDKLWRNEDGKRHTSSEFLVKVEAEIVRIIEEGGHPADRPKTKNPDFFSQLCFG